MPKLKASTRTFLRKIKPPQIVWRCIGFSAMAGLNAWMSTLNYRVFRYEKTADPADPGYVGPSIFIFWHEYIPVPVYCRPRCRLAMLVSQHQDAEILSHMASFSGLQTVRGSTSRGGTSALRELINRGSGMSLAITPDGPRGPRRTLAQGCVYLSSRLQIPIIPIGAGYSQPWRNKDSWDQFPVPRPFSRVRAVVGPRIQVPADLSRNDVEEYRLFTEQRLNDVTELAEKWADQNLDLPGSEILYRSPPQRRAEPARRAV